jgi:hypothetical protein
MLILEKGLEESHHTPILRCRDDILRRSEGPSHAALGLQNKRAFPVT